MDQRPQCSGPSRYDYWSGTVAAAASTAETGRPIWQN